MQELRLNFAAQNTHRHAKEIPRKLSAIWARIFKKDRQPCPRIH
jgi:hypothetical protein